MIFKKNSLKVEVKSLGAGVRIGRTSIISSIVNNFIYQTHTFGTTYPELETESYYISKLKIGHLKVTSRKHISHAEIVMNNNTLRIMEKSIELRGTKIK